MSTTNNSTNSSKFQQSFKSIIERFNTSQSQEEDDDDLSVNDIESQSIQVDETTAAEQQQNGSSPPVVKKEKKPWNVDAVGLSYLSSGRGMLTMSNIFMSSSLLYLAKEAAGCFEPTYTGIHPSNATIAEEIIVVDNSIGCDKTVYGMNPEAFITNIAAIGSVLSALFMPVCGAIVDYTPYRKKIGIWTAILMTLIQAVQIYTVESTWFVMGIFQAVAVLIYQIQIVAVLAYQPELSRDVGQKEMTKYTSHWSMINFVSSAFFLVVITVISIVFKTNDVVTAQISQGFNTLTLIVLFGMGWYKLTDRPAVRTLPEGHSLITEGFRQNFNTAKTVFNTYKKGMKWFFLAVIFAEAAATAVVSVAVTYLTSSIQLNSTELGIFFIVTLISTAIGTQIGGKWITKKLNPNLSWKLSMIYLFIVLVIGAFVLDVLPLELKSLSYIWAVFIGLGLGWFYPTGNLFFSMILPKGQEAEFAGFWVYCSQILAWLGPLLFSLLVTYNVEQKYGVAVVASGFLVGCGLLMFTGTWDEILLEAEYGEKLNSSTRSISIKNVRDLSRGDREALFGI